MTCEYGALPAHDPNDPARQLPKPQRAENLANAFKVHPERLQNGKILLIDDICTTGSTFNEMIKEFQKYGIDDIVCLATTTPFED